MCGETALPGPRSQDLPYVAGSLRQFRPHGSGSVAGLGSGQREGKRSDCRGKAPASRPQPRSALAGAGAAGARWPLRLRDTRHSAGLSLASAPRPQPPRLEGAALQDV